MMVCNMVIYKCLVLLDCKMFKNNQKKIIAKKRKNLVD